MQHLEKTVEFETAAGSLFGLVIDDQRSMRTIVRQMLNQMGIEDVVDCPEGLEAWNFLIRCGTAVPDFIICDLHMEGMDGLEFINAIRRSKNDTVHNIPVLVLTGDPDKFLHEVANQAGAAKVLQKPISTPDLREEIGGLLGLET